MNDSAPSLADALLPELTFVWVRSTRFGEQSARLMRSFSFGTWPCSRFALEPSRGARRLPGGESRDEPGTNQREKQTTDHEHRSSIGKVHENQTWKIGVEGLPKKSCQLWSWPLARSVPFRSSSVGYGEQQLSLLCNAYARLEVLGGRLWGES